MNFLPPSSDSRSNLAPLHDAVHGTIDLQDMDGEEPSMIARLLGSPPIARLRRIKQLGFASQSYPSADHSRYAHALGTMQVMRKLVERRLSLGTDVIRLLQAEQSKEFSGDGESIVQKFAQHLLVAGLLQDVGELPLGQASRHIYRPNDDLREFVEQKVGVSIADWSPKNIFTVACLYKAPTVDILSGLSLQLLVHLIVGDSSLSRDLKSNLQSFRHMLDGVVDADRLDYVFRDAYHTIGSFGSADLVINSLEYYDSEGPVFSDPAPVSSFLITRAHLHSAVYLSPADRFRTLTMLELLQGIKRREEIVKELFGGKPDGELDYDEFLRLDDVALTQAISRIAESPLKGRLDNRGQIALNIISSAENSYECYWIPRPEAPGDVPSGFDLPHELFFDTFADQARAFYPAESIRVRSRLFDKMGGIVPLEQCGGPFSALLRGNGSVLPMPDSILVFTPKQRVDAIWQQYNEAINNGSLYTELIKKDPLEAVNFPTDTRDLKGFEGPSLFVSFAFLDWRLVRRIARLLHDRHQRYYMLLERYEGVGGTTGDNSIEAVRQAEEVLILASSNYVDRFRDDPNGNIAKEVNQMMIEYDSRRLPIVVLSADSYRDIEKGLPWHQMGFDGVPYTGPALRDARMDQLKEAVDMALRSLD